MQDIVQPRPSSVRVAIALIGATVVLGLAKLVLTLYAPAGPGGHGFTVFTFLATYSVMTLLVIYLAMGASWARGGLLAVFLVGVAPGLPLAFAYFSVIPVSAVLTVAQVVATVVGLYLVYREPAASWFRKPDTVPAATHRRRGAGRR
ncbi:hypothetical protein [Salinisphaera sp. Q1T1-3]|uniref:hypothetical protein n=1 Tax=Salinisphaera sp. Q1T1-3 TaxID=2321229 RepID=UPI0011C4A4E1|nr:hypothetical protein [Salinisphaera sp. Q1T1-3]